jgi:hypothetical protein
MKLKWVCVLAWVCVHVHARTTQEIHIQFIGEVLCFTKKSLKRSGPLVQYNITQRQEQQTLQRMQPSPMPKQPNNHEGTLVMYTRFPQGVNICYHRHHKAN